MFVIDLLFFFQNVAIMEWQSVFLRKNGDDVPYDEDIWLHVPNYDILQVMLTFSSKAKLWKRCSHCTYTLCCWVSTDFVSHFQSVYIMWNDTQWFAFEMKVEIPANGAGKLWRLVPTQHVCSTFYAHACFGNWVVPLVE